MCLQCTLKPYIKYPLVMNVSVMQQSVHYISMYVFNSQLEKRGTILTLFGGRSITHSAICVCSSIQFSGGWVKLLSAITCTNLIISCFCYVRPKYFKNWLHLRVNFSELFMLLWFLNIFHHKPLVWICIFLGGPSNVWNEMLFHVLPPLPFDLKEV